MNIRTLKAGDPNPTGFEPFSFPVLPQSARQLKLFTIQYHRSIQGSEKVEVLVNKIARDHYDTPEFRKKVEEIPILIEDILPPPQAKQQENMEVKKPLKVKRKPGHIARTPKKKKKGTFLITLQQPAVISVSNPLKDLHSKEIYVIDELRLKIEERLGTQWGVIYHSCPNKGYGKSLGAWQNLEVNNYRDCGLKIIGLE